jgi:hypothetical protein
LALYWPPVPEYVDELIEALIAKKAPFVGMTNTTTIAPATPATTTAPSIGGFFFSIFYYIY